ncbi:MAG: phosphotransferase family protein [Gammaproteobacteria bacterium]
MNVAEIGVALNGFVADTFGASYRAVNVEESDGHAGLTFLFDVEDARGKRTGYVVKVPPAGVKLKGNTDVMRQAPLLNAMHEAGLPVPAVPFACAESKWFDRPFIVMERLPGRVFFVWEPHAEFARDGDKALGIWRQCVERLAEVHRFDWRESLSEWEVAEDLADNLGRWQKVYRHGLDASWIEQAEIVEQLLADRLPQDYAVGLFHGDFQPGNLLYRDHKFVAIIDWELAGISAPALDVGWMLMVVDRKNWIDAYHPVSPISEREVLSIYADQFGPTNEDYNWFQAFAGFRLASIACLNHKLHVTGKRPEPAWEKIGECIKPMLNRAQELLSG